MSETPSSPADQDPPDDDAPELLDPTGYGPEDVMGNGPVAGDPSPDPVPAGEPGDPELDADAETEPTA
ncbi:hypothetical protein [Aeromicrobium stalagmiti]|uniref:hypothetical protein n=1 Tax=Aeromicrobium stalagmiti TaxID=2738988 RepID=UPI0015696616|nr:hypothetical protein [Aeromicrobium stalagmiti]NRQ49067.1 hypothetical protein [Aeromicrobium stalagmiti]